MLLLYLILFIINLVSWQAILKVGRDSDTQIEIIMENYE